LVDLKKVGVESINTLVLQKKINFAVTFNIIET